MNSSVPAGIAEGVKTKVTFPPASPLPFMTLSTPGPTPLGSSFPLLCGPVQNSPTLMSTGKPASRSAACRPSRSWKYCCLSQVTRIVPSVLLSTVYAAVWMCTAPAAMLVPAELLPAGGWRGRRVHVRRHAERKTRGCRRTCRHARETVAPAARTASGHDLLDRGVHGDVAQRIPQRV
jgi:hypothetical protein